jgi:S-layer homology domain
VRDRVVAGRSPQINKEASVKRRHLIPGLALAALVAAGAPVWAQSPGSAQNDPNLNPNLAPKPRLVGRAAPGTTQANPHGTNAAWGTQGGATWIAASQFTVSLSGGPPLEYAGNHFYNSPGSATPTRYFAQLQVEPGVLISHLSCDYNDSSATNDIHFEWQKYTTDFSGGGSTSVVIDSFTSTGSPGVTFGFLDGPETMSVYNLATDDLVNHYIAVDLASDTSIAGCYAFWTRQVAPAPATATFLDVPTSHPFFQFIEALAASGITGGCGGGNFCPDNPVTRGQMATFLAKALGLGFPY